MPVPTVFPETMELRTTRFEVAVPEGWVDVTSVSDLAEVAFELRSAGRELRVATKYPNLTRQFLYGRGKRD